MKTAFERKDQIVAKQRKELRANPQAPTTPAPTPTPAPNGMPAAAPETDV